MGQSQKLARVQRLVDAGMPVSAIAAAREFNVQFTPQTLNRWRRGDGYNQFHVTGRGQRLTRCRMVYAIMVQEMNREL